MSSFEVVKSIKLTLSRRAASERTYFDSAVFGLFDARLYQEYYATHGSPIPWPVQRNANFVAQRLHEIAKHAAAGDNKPTT